VLRYRSCIPAACALAAAGHGGRVLIADANYPHSTGVSPRAAQVFLNLRAGLVTADQVLEAVLSAIPVEMACVMRRMTGASPRRSAASRVARRRPAAAPAGTARVLRGVPGARPGRLRRHGDVRLYANILLTIGFIRPAARADPAARPATRQPLPL